MHSVYLLIKLQIALNSTGDRLLYFYAGWLIVLSTIHFFEPSPFLLGAVLLFPNIYLFRVMRADQSLLENRFYKVLQVSEFHRHLAKQTLLVALLLGQLTLLVVSLNRQEFLLEMSSSILGLVVSFLVTIPLYKSRFENVKIFSLILCFIAFKFILNLIFQ